jgi:hypothetical protein
MTGSDWRQYEPFYDKFKINTNLQDSLVEPGFLIYVYLFKLLDVGFWPFAIFTKIVSILIFIFFIKKHAPENANLAIAFFLVSYGLYYYIDNPLRNLIAASIFLFSLQYLIKRDFIKFLLVVLLAASFHYSALITIPFYFLVNVDLKKSTWVIVYSITILISVLYKGSLIDMISSTFSDNLYIGGKIDFYFNEGNYIDSRIFTFGGLAKLVFFLLTVYYKDEIIRMNSYGKFYFNWTMFFFIINRFAASIEIISRFQMYFAVLFCITIVLFIQHMDFVIGKLYKILVLLIIYFTMYKEITSTYKYIPYTNYLFYMNNDKSFDERVNYNFLNSPYREKE